MLSHLLLELLNILIFQSLTYFILSTKTTKVKIILEGLRFIRIQGRPEESIHVDEGMLLISLLISHNLFFIFNCYSTLHDVYFF